MHNHVASLTYVCFIPAKGLIRDLSANSSNIAFEVPLASKWWWQSGLISHHFKRDVWRCLDVTKTIIPQARMGSESIAHEAKGLHMFPFQG